MSDAKQRFFGRILERAEDLPERLADGVIDFAKGFLRQITEEILGDEPSPKAPSSPPTQNNETSKD